MADKMSAQDLHERKDRITIIDIRKEPDDKQIPGSVRYDGAALESGETLPFSEKDEVVLYCGSGNSCSRIAESLRDRGFNTTALDGGYRAWKDAGFETEQRAGG